MNEIKDLAEQILNEIDKGPWTSFFDMSSGGRNKLEWNHIYIQAPQKLAIEIFKEMFDRDPDNVTCTCCGEDYSVTESKSLKQATAYNRSCRYDDKSREWVEKPDLRYGGKGTDYISFASFVKTKKFKSDEEVKLVFKHEFPDNWKT